MVKKLRMDLGFYRVLRLLESSFSGNSPPGRSAAPTSSPSPSPAEGTGSAPPSWRDCLSLVALPLLSPAQGGQEHLRETQRQTLKNLNRIWNIWADFHLQDLNQVSENHRNECFYERVSSSADCITYFWYWGAFVHWTTSLSPPWTVRWSRSACRPATLHSN